LLRSALDRSRTLRERPRAAFLTGAETALPQIEEGLEPRLERQEAEPIGRVPDMQPIDSTHRCCDARTRLHGRTRQPAGEVHVVFGFELTQLGLEPFQLTLDLRRFGH